MRIYCCLIACAMCLGGCSPVTQEDPFESKRETKKQQTMTQTTQGGVQHMQGSAQIDYQSNKGSWSMSSTADDYHYNDETTFNPK